MNDRPNDLIKIRPILNLKKSSQISDEESFQNDTKTNNQTSVPFINRDI